MSEYAENLKLFQRVLIEASDEKAQRILAEYPEEIVFSKHHEKIMHKILTSSRKYPTVGHGRMSRKKRMMILLVAILVLLLSGLTVYASRDALVRFVEQIHEKYISVFYQKEHGADVPDTIEKEYTLSYVPEGYELKKYEAYSSSVQSEWRNPSNEYILFVQNVIGGSIYNFDNEHGNFEEWMVEEYHVFTARYATSNVYLWNDGQYSYFLDCSEQWSFEEISQMILSVKEKE